MKKGLILRAGQLKTFKTTRCRLGGCSEGVFDYGSFCTTSRRATRSAKVVGEGSLRLQGEEDEEKEEEEEEEGVEVARTLDSHR